MKKFVRLNVTMIARAINCYILRFL